MAFLVLLTTMSFAVDMHFCGDTLVDFSFVQNVKTCGMEKAQSTVGCESPVLSKKSCCSDKQFVKEGKDDLKITFDSLSLDQQLFVATFTYTYINLFEGTQSLDVPFTDYPPPFIERDVQVLYQSFLI